MTQNLARMRVETVPDHIEFDFGDMPGGVLLVGVHREELRDRVGEVVAVFEEVGAEADVGITSVGRHV